MSSFFFHIFYEERKGEIKKERLESQKATLTVKELGERWSVPLHTIYTKINDGSIPVLPLDGPKRILLSTIEEIEYESGFKSKKGKSIRERKLEKEIQEYEERLKECENLLLEISKLLTEIFIRFKL